MDEVVNISDLSREYYPDSHMSGASELHALIADCKKNNIISQRKLFEMYVPLIYGVIKRYVYNDAIAEELLNDTFFTIFTKLDQYSFKGSFEGWMRQIAVNMAGMHFRKNGKRDRLFKTDVDAGEDFFIDDTVAKIGYKEILQFIHELPDTPRAVFNLYVMENYSHKEIGKLLKITDNNSRWHLNDARRRLKEKIKSTM